MLAIWQKILLCKYRKVARELNKNSTGSHGALEKTLSKFGAGCWGDWFTGAGHPLCAMQWFLLCFEPILACK